MRERIVVDGVPCVRRGHNYVTKATDELLNNIERSVVHNALRSNVKQKWTRWQKARESAAKLQRGI